jgi:NTE family protein
MITTDPTETLPELARKSMPDTHCVPHDGIGQVVLVLQGGGALGAYQGGVFQALCEGGIAPDWVIGTSIGAINAAIIAGNRPEDRLDRLNRFWSLVRHDQVAQWLGQLPWLGSAAANAVVFSRGVQGFFEPNPSAWLGTAIPLGPERAAFYSVEPLRRTLTELIDFDLLNEGDMRLTVGAAAVSTGMMRYFDSRRERITLNHVLASGALPPAFPAVRIDGELYWDGGVLSNTPVEAVFDDRPRNSGLIFAVHIWNPEGAEPSSIDKVIAREKDIRYASRSQAHIERQRQLHRLRHVITELAGALPPELREDQRLQELIAYGCVTRMHVVRLLAPPLMGEDHSKDIDFSPAGIETRWMSGYRDTMRVLDQRPWEGEFDPMEGMILHEARAGEVIA